MSIYDALRAKILNNSVHFQLKRAWFLSNATHATNTGKESNKRSWRNDKNPRTEAVSIFLRCVWRNHAWPLR